MRRIRHDCDGIGYGAPVVGVVRRVARTGVSRSIYGVGYIGRALPLLMALGCGGGGETSGPDPNQVASVVVTPPSATLTNIGATSQLSAEARNASGAAVSGKTFSWTSSNGAVATVSGSGLVTATGGGTTTIRATVSGGTTSGTAAVTVQQTVVAVALAPSATSVTVGGTLQLAANATDGGGATVSNATFAWSSSNSAVAAVSPTGLVTGVSAGSADITVTSNGISAQRTLSVRLPGLNIAKDTTISGNLVVDGFTVAAGFTVTVNGPLTLHSNDLLSIAGTLTGDCQPFDIVGDTAVSITGNVSNGCAAGLTGQPLRITSTGEFVLNGASIVGSGPITLSNNPALSGLARQAATQRQVSTASASAGIASAQIANSTVRFAGTSSGPPNPAPPGASGANGTSGGNAIPMALVFDGNVAFTGNNVVWAQDGGTGGDGVNSSTSDLSVTAGNGGTGGLLRLAVGGTLTFSGVSNVFQSGAGGSGGSASAFTLQTATGNQAPSATATGGRGGNSGVVQIEAAGGTSINQQGALTLLIGFPGDGGDATAHASNGTHGTAAKAPQTGGNASATGGAGGGTPDVTVIGPTPPTGFQPLLSGPNGGAVDGGRGGTAQAGAGDGGEGFKPNKTGGMGGAAIATGGVGGMAALAALGSGGAGGLAWLSSGNGGIGWDACTPPGMFEPGGAGGGGGNATGTEGVGGTGKLGPGTNGGVLFDGSSNGGNGGNGIGVGAAGAAGTKTASGTEQHVGPTFSPGQPGSTCSVTPNAPPAGEHFYMQMAGGWNDNSIGQIGPGPRTRSLLSSPGGPVIGQVTITTMGGAPQPPFYVRTNPARIGQVGPNFWDLNVASVMEGAAFPNVETFTLCFLNEDPLPSGPSPIFVDQRDNFGVVWDSDVIAAAGGPIADGRAGCRMYPLHQNATHVRWYRAGSATSEVDWIGFTKKLTP
ncbi:MAG TPA: Ig-like domain-containing protein [Gemmatimonadaceae bacterium]